jgi:putative aminopeptidase FrvX
MKTIKDYLIASDNVMFDACLKELFKRYPSVKTDGENYIYAAHANRPPVCLVAHLDTVCTGGFKRLVSKNGVIRNVNGVLGADDRAGVYGIFALLSMPGVDMFDVLITNYEETGGKGAYRATEDLDLDGYRIFIELDRQGIGEYVVYNDVPKEIHEWAAGFGLVQQHGSFSDIRVLSGHTGIPSVNISIGYYYQHTEREQLRLSHMESMIQICSKMVADPPDQLYECLSVHKYRRLECPVCHELVCSGKVFCINCGSLSI